MLNATFAKSCRTSDIRNSPRFYGEKMSVQSFHSFIRLLRLIEINLTLFVTHSGKLRARLSLYAIKAHYQHHLSHSDSRSRHTQLSDSWYEEQFHSQENAKNGNNLFTKEKEKNNFQVMPRRWWWRCICVGSLSSFIALRTLRNYIENAILLNLCKKISWMNLFMAKWKAFCFTFCASIREREREIKNYSGDTKN